MNKNKANLAVVSTLLFALIPKLDKAIKRQMLSLISLVISSMFILMPFAPAVSAAGPVSYTVNKTVIDVSGQGPAGNVTAAGDIISYQINVDNTAGAPLTNVTVSDPMIGIINNVTNLSEGSNETLYGNYTVIQADIDNNGNGTGFIINNVTVVCDQNTTATNSTATVPITSCTIVETVTGVTGDGNGNVTAAGDIISYEINVNNTAGMDLTNVTVNDPMLGGILNVTDLGIGSNETLYGNYTVTQADINNNGNGTGFIINNATVDCDQLGPKNTTVTTPIKSCTIVKTVTGVTGDGNGNVTAAGDIISYEINVNNTAGMDLTNVTVTDPMLGLLNDTNLSIGSNETLYGNYTVTRADITNNGNGTGFIINNATVDCDQLGPKNTTVQIPIDTAASIEGIVTDVAGQGPAGNVTAAGDIITYQVNVTNNGITDLTNVTVNDTLATLTGLTSSINNDTVLNPGEIWTYTGNYTVTQADINNNGTVEGRLVNNASTFETAAKGIVKSTEASETAGDGLIKNTMTFDSDQLGPKDDTIQVPLERDPHYSISKSVIAPDESGDCIVNSPGDEIPYRIVVNNDGNVNLTGVSVNDPMISLTGPTGDDNEDSILNPGETWVFDGIYKLTKDDINNGNNIDNTATVSSNELPEESSDVSQPIEQKVDLSIQKSITGIDEAGDFMINQPGDVINYRIAVENNGDVDLHNVHVADSLIDDLSGPIGDSIDPGVLNPGETWMYDGDYIVTPADIESNGGGSGFITNTATVHCDEHSSESSSIEVPIIPASNFGNDENPGSDLKADFSANPKSGYAPLSVQFTDKSTGSPTSWSWDFNNDGFPDSSEMSPAYTYTTPGTYVAKLTVSNANGTDAKPETINVLQTATSNDGGGSGGSIGRATVGGSHST
jgi:trimeric autotransporter adhesin